MLVISQLEREIRPTTCHVVLEARSTCCFCATDDHNNGVDHNTASITTTSSDEVSCVAVAEATRNAEV